MAYGVAFLSTTMNMINMMINMMMKNNIIIIVIIIVLYTWVKTWS